MITVYVFSNKVQAKLQRRDRKGRFAKSLPKPRDIKNNPLVTFYYPMSDQPWNSRLRQVRLISATSTHITGLEMSNYRTPSGATKTRYQFKKFSQPKVSEFKVQTFNPTSMS